MNFLPRSHFAPRACGRRAGACRSCADFPARRAWRDRGNEGGVREPSGGAAGCSGDVPVFTGQHGLAAQCGPWAFHGIDERPGHGLRRAHSARPDLRTSTPVVAPPDTTCVLALLYLAIFGSIIGFTIYLLLVVRVGSSRAAYATVLFPIVAITLSALFEDYHITATTIVGILLAMAGNIVMFSNGDFTLLALGRKADGWRKAKQDGSNDNRLREQGPQIMSLRISSDHFPLLFVPSPMSQNEAYGK